MLLSCCWSDEALALHLIRQSKGSSGHLQMTEDASNVTVNVNRIMMTMMTERKTDEDCFCFSLLTLVSSLLTSHFSPVVSSPSDCCPLLLVSSSRMTSRMSRSLLQKRLECKDLVKELDRDHKESKKREEESKKREKFLEKENRLPLLFFSCRLFLWFQPKVVWKDCCSWLYFTLHVILFLKLCSSPTQSLAVFLSLFSFHSMPNNMHHEQG